MKRYNSKYELFETAEKLAEIKQLVKDGLTDSKIAERIGVDKSQLSRWRRTRPLIREALTRLVTIDGKQIDKHDLPHGGKGRKLNNVAELQERVKQWIERCRKDNLVLTVSGLCLELNISKNALNNYINTVKDETEVYRASKIDGEMRPVSVCTVLKEAKLAIENDIEQRMLANKCNVAGAIFDLKNNHGYADKSEITSVQSGKRAVTDDELDKRIGELLKKSGGKDNVIDFKKSV